MNPLFSSSRIPLVALIAGVLSAVPLRVAYAEPSQADMAQARELLGEGLELREKGDNAGALEKLKAAHALANTPITGFELGQAYVAVGRLVEAREVLVSTVQMPVRTGETSRSATARTQAEALAEQLRSRVPSVRIKITGVAPDSVALTIDGAVIPSAALEAPRFVDPGPHVIAARSTAGGAAQTRVDLREGESRDVELKIVLTSASASDSNAATSNAATGASAPIQAISGPPVADSSGETNGALGTAGWVLVGAGAALGIAGGVLMGVEASKASDARGAHDVASYNATATPWTVGLVGVIAGSASAATGAILVLTAHRPAPNRAHAAVQLGINARGLQLMGSW